MVPRRRGRSHRVRLAEGAAVVKQWFGLVLVRIGSRMAGNPLTVAAPVHVHYHVTDMPELALEIRREEAKYRMRNGMTSLH